MVLDRDWVGVEVIGDLQGVEDWSSCVTIKKQGKKIGITIEKRLGV